MRLTLDRTLDALREKAGLPLLFTARKHRGRPLIHPHPFPRRDPLPGEAISEPTTHRKHEGIFVNGCVNCYQREYLYFKKHPNKKPPEMWWKHQEEGGRHSTVTGAPREWKDAGWADADDRRRKAKDEVKNRREFYDAKVRRAK